MKGSIRRQGERSWEVRVYLGRGANNRKLYRSHTVRGTKKDAERELARLVTQIHSGEYVEPNRMTTGEYLEKWLADYAKANVTAKTFERYEEMVKKHLTPALGHIRLAKLAPLHVQAYYTEALQKGRRDGSGGLSAKTVLHLHRLLREALQQAVRWQLVVRNVADAVEPPRPVRKEMRALDEGQTARLLEAAAGTRLFLPILLAVTTGARRGELLALRWSNVDLDSSRVTIRQSLEQTRRRLAFKTPKNGKARVVALPPLAAEALRRHKVEQAKTRLMMGSAYADQGLVLARPDGRPFDPSETSKAFRKLIRKTKLPVIRFHDLRHGHATHLLRQNVPLKVVSERLGHSGIAITGDPTCT